MTAAEVVPRVLEVLADGAPIAEFESTVLAMFPTLERQEVQEAMARHVQAGGRIHLERRCADARA